MRLVTTTELWYNFNLINESEKNMLEIFIGSVRDFLYVLGSENFDKILVSPVLKSRDKSKLIKKITGKELANLSGEDILIQRIASEMGVAYLPLIYFEDIESLFKHIAPFIGIRYNLLQQTTNYFNLWQAKTNLFQIEEIIEEALLDIYEDIKYKKRKQDEIDFQTGTLYFDRERINILETIGNQLLGYEVTEIINSHKESIKDILENLLKLYYTPLVVTDKDKLFFLIIPFNAQFILDQQEGNVNSYSRGEGQQVLIDYSNILNYLVDVLAVYENHFKTNVRKPQQVIIVDYNKNCFKYKGISNYGERNLLNVSYFSPIQYELIKYSGAELIIPFEFKSPEINGIDEMERLIKERGIEGLLTTARIMPLLTKSTTILIPNIKL